MNIARLRANTPVLIKHIRKEYNLSYKHLAMIFKVQPSDVVDWEFAKAQPDEDMINAMILAYRWVRIWKPFKLFLGLTYSTTTRSAQFAYSGISRFIKEDIFKKPGQRPLGLDIS